MRESKRWLLAGVVLLSCAGSRQTRLDPALFAPRAEWTPTSYRLAPVKAPVRLRQPDLVADLGFLQHMLETGWAWRSRVTPASHDALLEDLHELARSPLTPAAFCQWLAVTLRNTGIAVSSGATSCRAGTFGDDGPIEHLVTTDRAVDVRRLADAAGDDVTVMTVRRFDAGDPAWPDALRQVAAADRVIVDVQEAGGDGSALALGLLAALGIDAYGDWTVPTPERRDGPFPEVARATLDDDRAETFLAGCPGAVVGDSQQYAPRRVTYMHVSATRDVVAQISRAPFVTSVVWDCPDSLLNGTSQ